MIALASSRLVEASSRPGTGLLLPSDFRNIRNRMPLRIPLPKSLTSKGCKHTHECGRSVDKGLGTKFIYHTIVITGIGMGANSRIGTGDESQQKIRAVFRTIRTVSTGLKYSTVPDYCIYNNGLNPTQELL